MLIWSPFSDSTVIHLPLFVLQISHLCYMCVLQGALAFLYFCLHSLPLAWKVTANVCFYFPVLQFFAFFSRGQEVLYSLVQQFRDLKYKRRIATMEDGIINRGERPLVCFLCLCKYLAIIVFHDLHSAELTQSF